MLRPDITMAAVGQNGSKDTKMPEEVGRFSVRVYYEDTDFSGRVYHVSYLRFLERGRTEWLRSSGLQHSRLAESGLAFAVVKMQADFLAPAFVDDVLEVRTEIFELRGPVLIFRQSIARDETVLLDGLVEVVTIRGNRPVRPPRALFDLIRPIKRQ